MFAVFTASNKSCGKPGNETTHRYGGANPYLFKPVLPQVALILSDCSFKYSILDQSDS